MSNEFKAGDRAYTKVGRNLVEVRVKAKTETGWTVTTRTGRTLAVRSLEAVPGAAAGIASAGTPKACIRWRVRYRMAFRFSRCVHSVPLTTR